ncbi:MAG: nuclear transport factor 2 family protein [Ilumatobacteraceae bacterium]
MTSTTSTPTEQPTTGASLRFAIAGRFIDGIAARDFGVVVATLTDDVTFRALLPRKVLDLNGRAAVRAAFDTWFGAVERWELVEAVVGEVGDRLHLRWRLRLTNAEVGPGTFLVEQQVYADSGPDGRLRNVALLCTGYLRDAS